MKELSIEQKAQRYDKALKVLHKYDGANIMFSQSLKEEMFPELVESEDERIKKELIEFVKSRGGFKQEYIDWLEKQGEQKPTDNQFTPEQAGVLDKHIDKFLEQNRTWSEEDEQYVKDTLALLAFGVSVHTISQVQDWLNSLKDKYIWKPSDEQMDALRYVTNFDYGGYKATLVSLCEQLKKL